MQWKAGESGEKPFYFGCAKCRDKEPEIAGFYSTNEKPDFFNILTVPSESGLVNLAMYCGKCWTADFTE